MLTMLFFHKKKVLCIFTCIFDLYESTMLLHDYFHDILLKIVHADCMDTTLNEKGLVINGLFFSVTVVLVMIYMVFVFIRKNDHAIITMRFIASTIAFYHAIYSFSCRVCSLFWCFLPMLSVVISFFHVFGSFFLHGAYYAFR